MSKNKRLSKLNELVELFRLGVIDKDEFKKLKSEMFSSGEAAKDYNKISKPDFKGEGK